MKQTNRRELGIPLAIALLTGQSPEAHAGEEIKITCEDVKADRNKTTGVLKCTVAEGELGNEQATDCRTLQRIKNARSVLNHEAPSFLKENVGNSYSYGQQIERACADIKKADLSANKGIHISEGYMSYVPNYEEILLATIPGDKGPQRMWAVNPKQGENFTDLFGDTWIANEVTGTSLVLENLTDACTLTGEIEGGKEEVRIVSWKKQNCVHQVGYRKILNQKTLESRSSILRFN